MAAETPFGASFGDPRRYMGQSPLAEIGKGLKAGLTAYALKESGFTDYLNKLNPKPVAGAVPPSTPSAAPQVAPMMPVSPTANFETAPSPTVDITAPPADIGTQILDEKWDGFINPQSQKDFNPDISNVSNQVPMTGNEYQQVPGYGKLQKIAGQFMGMK